MKNSTVETPRVEEGKVIAERLNGLAASIGCLALVGAYLTTGQIIPGIFQTTITYQLLKTMQPSNKTILERSIGRPAMMAFVLLTGVYLTTGQLIPGVV